MSSSTSRFRPSTSPVDGSSVRSVPTSSYVTARAQRWSSVRVPSVAAVTVALSEAVRESESPTRVGGPITSLILASVLDTPSGDMRASGISLWVETDRRDDRRDGWTVDRAGLDGRWVLLHAERARQASGTSSDGIPDHQHAVWVDLLGGPRPDGVDVQAWQRVDRTSWVLHDGDGEVFVELTIDEQRHMGTQEVAVEARLVSPAGHVLFDELIHPLSECFGNLPDRFRGSDVASVDSSSEPSVRICVEPGRAEPASPALSPPVAVVPANAFEPPGFDELSWVIRCAVDVDSLVRHGQAPSKRAVRHLGALIGSAPALRAIYFDASTHLDAVLPDLVLLEQQLVDAADTRWAIQRLGTFIGSAAGPVDWTRGAAVAPIGAVGVTDPGSALRGSMLAMLEQTDHASSAVGLASTVHATVLAESTAAWLGAVKSRRRQLEPRRHAELRAALCAFRVASETGRPPSELHRDERFEAVISLERDLRWLRRRTALITLIERSAQADGPVLPPDGWMRLGVLVEQTRAALPGRTRRAVRRARQVQRRLSNPA